MKFYCKILFRKKYDKCNNFRYVVKMEDFESFDFLRGIIRENEGIKFKNISELAEKAGVNQGNLSSFLNAKPGNVRANMKFDTAWKILKFLGYLDDITNSKRATISRPAEYSPKEQLEGQDLFPIPVYAVAGAGPAWLPTENEPLFNVFAPTKYLYDSDFAVQVEGHSMEPLIPHKSIVGIKSNVPFQANELYLANIPYEGLVVKRIGIDRKNEEFIFKSENSNKEAYPDFRLTISEAEKIIIGRVVWVLIGY